MSPLVLLAAQLFTIEGRIVPGTKALVTVHSATTPYTASSSAHADGKFKVGNLEPGTYTLIVFIDGSGEVRNSINVGPSTADRKRVVRIAIDLESSTLSREEAHLVTARALAVSDAARREYAAALRRLNARDIDKAIAHLRRATEIAPEFAAAWNYLGTIAYQTKRLKDAEANFRRALHADPDLYEPLVNLGGVLVTTGQLDEALRINTRAIARKPDDPLAHSQLGMAYLFLNQLEPAERHLRKAVDLDPRHFSHPQLHLAEVYRRRGDTNGAAGQLEGFLRHHPDSPDAPRIRDLLRRWR